MTGIEYGYMWLLKHPNGIPVSQYIVQLMFTLDAVPVKIFKEQTYQTHQQLCQFKVESLEDYFLMTDAIEIIEQPDFASKQGQAWTV